MPAQENHYKLARTILGKASQNETGYRNTQSQSNLENQDRTTKLTDYYRTEIEKILLKYYFFKNREEVFGSVELKKDLEDHVQNRYIDTLVHYIPWIESTVDLHNCELIEIGAGTGSSTAAFSNIVKQIHAYEIAENSVKIARRRIELLQADNVLIYQCRPEQLLHEVRQRHRSGVSAFLLFAVLEHMTIHERLETLQTAWDLLKPGGILIVAETPNRLTYHDHHTTWLPFFHMLPLELAVSYLESIPRETISQIMAHVSHLDLEERIETLTRLGNAVSFHEFEIAFGQDLNNLVIADGSFESIRRLYPVTREEEILRQYFTEKNISQPLAFCNAVLNIIFRKPIN